MKINSNIKWEDATPLISIIMPNFNRTSSFERAFESACLASKNYPCEIIIIDDGSTENVLDVYLKCLSNSDLPILIIFKENGGVHTARNKGIDYARGKFCIFLDSDDELCSDCFYNFLNFYDSLSKERKSSLFEIKARCKNQNGKATSILFPPNFNQLDIKSQRSFLEKRCGELIGFRKTEILKKNKFPEPSGITFVMENILWDRLRNEYKSLYINDIARIYHTENNDHLISVKRKSTQHCKNRLWNHWYILSHSETYLLSKKNVLIFVCIYNIFKLLLLKDKEFLLDKKIPSKARRAISYLLMPLCAIVALVYKLRYLSK